MMTLLDVCLNISGTSSSVGMPSSEFLFDERPGYGFADCEKLSWFKAMLPTGVWPGLRHDAHTLNIAWSFR